MQRTGWHRRLGMIATLLGIAIAGCSTAPQDRGIPPEDGVIAAAVVVGSDLGHRIQRDPAAWPVEVRPSRAVILADGSLRADVGPSLGVDDRPGVTRHLRRSQLVSLWKRLEDLGLAEIASANFDRNPNLLVPGPDEVIQILEIRRNGRDWMVIDRFTVAEDADRGTNGPDGTLAAENPRMRAALRAIAALAWASDAPPDDTVRFPERYDFGPDPWVRYRVASPDDDS
ncbi:MAG: hypothetical protein GY895_16210 [Phycisphaera sp.]|nr:hypothetical protein [Phycisphaera sp.]